MKRKLLLLTLSVCLAVSCTALAVSAEGSQPAVGAVWTADAGSVYSVTGTAGGGIGTVSYSANPWTVTGEGTTAETAYQAIRIPVSDYVSAAETPLLSMKFVNHGAYLYTYLAYAAGVDENMEPYPADIMFVSVGTLHGDGWNTTITDYGSYQVSTIDFSSYIGARVVTDIVLYFEKSPAESSRDVNITETKSVEFQGMLFHTKADKPFTPTDASISAPTASSGIVDKEITKNEDGSYRVGYTTGANYSRFLVNFANFTAEDKCLTFEFTPYAGMKFGLYVFYQQLPGEASAVDKMISDHKVYPAAEKQTIKFELDGTHVIDHLKLYVDVNLPIDEMVYFTLNSVTLEKNWPVLFSGFTPKDSASEYILTEDGVNYTVKAHGSAYYQMIGSVNSQIWKTKPMVKHLVISFTPAQEIKIGVYVDDSPVAGKDAAGKTVSGHTDYPAGVRQTLTFDLSDEDYPEGPGMIQLYIDPGVATTEDKTLALHEANVYPEPNITDFTAGNIYYTKYDPATRETIVKYSEHGTWHKISAPISDYREGYDVIAFRVKADRKMYLGLRLTNANEVGGTGNADLRLHLPIEADTQYDFVYTGFVVNENTMLEIYCDAPGSAYEPVPEGETVLTIQSIDFLRSADLKLPTLTVAEQTVTREYTGENQVIEPVVGIDSPVNYTLEYRDTAKEGAKWSAVAPIDAGTYDVRVVTELTREYMTVTDEGHIRLVVTKSQTPPVLPDAAVAYNYEEETVIFGADYEVNRADSFAAATALKSGDKITPGEKLYARVKETSNTVAGAAKTLTVPGRPAAPEAPGIDFAASSTDAAVSAAIEYSSDDGATWTAGAGEKLQLAPGSTYLLRLKATATAFTSETAQLTVPARPAKPAAPVLKESGTDYIELEAAAGLEYRVNGGAWQDSPRFEGLEANTEYTVEARVKLSAGGFGSEIVSAKFSTQAGENGAGGCGCGALAVFGGPGIGGLSAVLFCFALAMAGILLSLRRRAR